MVFISISDDEPKVEKASIEFILMTRKGNKQQV